MISFRVEDMSCGHCVATITKAVQGADPLAQVQIDLPQHQVGVESSLLDQAKLSQLIKEAGYTPSPL